MNQDEIIVYNHMNSLPNIGHTGGNLWHSGLIKAMDFSVMIDRLNSLINLGFVRQEHIEPEKTLFYIVDFRDIAQRRLNG